MPYLSLIHFPNTSSLLSSLPEALRSNATTKSVPFMLGPHIQDPETLQLTYESENNSVTTAVESVLRDSGVEIPQGKESVRALVDADIFRSGGVGESAGAVEFVQQSFPASLATPEFQAEKNADFKRFHDIYASREGARGELGLAVGWSPEELDVEEFPNEKAISFFVAKSWTDMDAFKEGTETEAFRRALPILLAWNAKGKLWHVEPRAWGGW